MMLTFKPILSSVSFRLQNLYLLRLYENKVIYVQYFINHTPSCIFCDNIYNYCKQQWQQHSFLVYTNLYFKASPNTRITLSHLSLLHRTNLHLLERLHLKDSFSHISIKCTINLIPKDAPYKFDSIYNASTFETSVQRSEN